jgi:hypothetical protein
VPKPSRQIKIRVDAQHLPQWRDLLKRKKINQQEAVSALIGWIIDQDDLLQSLLFGQVQSRRDLRLLIIKRLKAQTDHPRRRGGGNSGA